MLEYVTKKENHERASRLGLKASGDRHGSRLHPETRHIGEANGNSRYTLVQAKAVKHDRLTLGLTYTALAIKHGVSKKFVGDVVKEKTWRHA